MPTTTPNSSAIPAPFNRFVDAQAHRYDMSQQSSTYTRDDGFLVLPVAAPLNVDGSSPPPRVIRVHAPYGMRSYQFAEQKRGAAPVLPAMADTPSGDKFLGAELAFSTPAIGGANNQLDFAAAGVYTFVQGCSANSAGSIPGVRGTTTNDVYQNGIRPYQTDLFWTTALAAFGLVGGGATFTALQGLAQQLTQQQIATNPNYLYLTDNFVGNFFSSDLIN